MGDRPGARRTATSRRWPGWPSSTRSAPTPSRCCWAGSRPRHHRRSIAGSMPPASGPSCRRCPRRQSATTCAAGSRAGWVRPQRALGRTWIIPTPGGLDLAGSGYRPWTLVPCQLNHLHAVAVVRLAIETANPQAEWFSERALTRLRAQRRETWWRPDGGLVVRRRRRQRRPAAAHHRSRTHPQAPGQAPTDLRAPLPR